MFNELCINKNWRNLNIVLCFKREIVLVVVRATELQDCYLLTFVAKNIIKEICMYNELSINKDWRN